MENLGSWIIGLFCLLIFIVLLIIIIERIRHKFILWRFKKNSICYNCKWRFTEINEITNTYYCQGWRKRFSITPKKSDNYIEFCKKRIKND